VLVVFKDQINKFTAVDESEIALVAGEVLGLIREGTQRNE
jgi:hypothetical protein